MVKNKLQLFYNQNQTCELKNFYNNNIMNKKVKQS